MAEQSNADKVFVALPETYEEGITVLSWALNYFSRDKTKIIITHVMTSPFKGLLGPRPLLIEREKLDLVLNKYLSRCATLKFSAEKLVYTADEIAEGIIELIARYEVKNLVMKSAANIQMMELASETANEVMLEADMSCKLWFVYDGDLIFTREANSDKLTPAPPPVERLLLTEQSNQNFIEASSSTSDRSNGEAPFKEQDIVLDADINKMLLEASLETGNLQVLAEEEFIRRAKFEKEMFRTQKKLALLVTKLTKELQWKEQQSRELQEILEGEKEEADILRHEVEELKHEKSLLNEELELMQTENDRLTAQANESSNQIQAENERRLGLEKQVADLEAVIKDLQAVSVSTADCIDSLQSDCDKLSQERDNLAREAEALRKQREDMLSSSSTGLNSKFSLQELEQATQSFSESLKIGEGGFGSVYKGSLRQTTVAIKVLHSQNLGGQAQFQQEVMVLTNVRHPNLVTLIGACSEASALVYEYLPNGSLEDRLLCANNTLPLSWQVRTRIIGEICLALIFLHSNKPQLVVHGDLKPDNILLDANLVSKLSDFGISRLLIQPNSNTTAFYRTKHPSGTLFYTDPENFSTGMLTPKSDIYSFGIIILRLLTAKPPLNIAREVQNAMRNGTLLSVIDESAGKWPLEQAEELAKIGLRCADLSRRQRPNLVTEVWTVVEPLMKAASAYVEPIEHGSDGDEEQIPSLFVCPILQEVMQDPHIAADGFTYEADAIRRWIFGGHNTSPMTNLELPHHNLIPNHVLRSAIQEWLHRHP
ncbi:U-box domain-containing protein kinase family protein [Rhynchospora pubera]|uniref:RING-type E3 ubiquitin transferase n=1 Tax=Rhynchospora pubera TaxID=906938 RepID=A0AAV8GIX3_9POAL|nr:U-box domain-containing protein kinase family protein [Rhynchospora pubera]